MFFIYKLNLRLLIKPFISMTSLTEKALISQREISLLERKGLIHSGRVQSG